MLVSNQYNNFFWLTNWFSGGSGLDPPAPHPDGPCRPQSELGGRPRRPLNRALNRPHKRVSNGLFKRVQPSLWGNRWPHGSTGQPSPHRYLLPNCDIKRLQRPGSVPRSRCMCKYCLQWNHGEYKPWSWDWYIRSKIVSQFEDRMDHESWPSRVSIFSSVVCLLSLSGPVHSFLWVFIIVVIWESLNNFAL